jgi:SAM-dependent methyltransferase
MKGLTITSYGDAIADIYDDFHPIDPAAAVDFLSAHARGGSVLELGVGTGRVALPLAALGLAVHGVDASDAMLDQLRAKPGADRVALSKGDFGETHAGDGFALAYVVFNTFFALASFEAQKRCFHNVAKQLRPGGRFVLEVFVPDLARFPDGQALRPGRIEADRLVLEATRHDKMTQTLDAQLVLITTDGIRLVPIKLRYAWPSELDLMAELAGLRFVERWGSFRKDPFTAASTQHVSVYEKV